MNRLNSIFFLIIFFTYFKLVYTSGHIKFSLLDFSTNGTLENGNCCQNDVSRNDCQCTVYVHICVSVGFEITKFYRDCWVAYHGSDMLAVNKLTNSYNASIKFTKWPTTNVSLTVEVRQLKSKNLILRSERFFKISPAGSKSLQFQETKPGKSITYQLEVTCDENYYGAECSVYCNPNISNAHHQCSPEGNLMCKEGWSGFLCYDPVCTGGCGHGSCVSPGTCSCNLGWKGSNCDECVVKEGCMNGYCQKPFECICEKNWGGLLCERDLDYCYHNSPCQNGGKCSSGGKKDYYYCNCTSGYTGRNCEYKVNPCSNAAVCGEFGACLLSNLSRDGYFCICEKTHYGRHCEHKIQTFEGLLPQKGLIHIPLPNSCALSNTDFVPSGYMWTTNNCHLCTCSKGIVNCVRNNCKGINSPCNFRSDSCGKFEVFLPKLDEECLKSPCSLADCGRCVSLSQKNREKDIEFCRSLQSERRIEESNLCAALFLEMNVELLHKGTTTEDVCYHLVHEIELFGPLEVRAALHCTKFDEAIVQVDFASSDFTSNATVLKDFLKRRLQSPLTTSAIIRSIQRIAERDSTNVLVWGTNLRKSVGDDFADREKLISANHILAVIVLLLVLVFLILLSTCLFKYGEWVCSKRRCIGETELKEVPSWIYYTQPVLQKTQLKRHSTITVDHKRTLPLEPLNYSSQNCCSLRSLYDVQLTKEMEDNERNAQILRKSKNTGLFQTVKGVNEKCDFAKLRKLDCASCVVTSVKSLTSLKERPEYLDRVVVV